MEGPVFDFNCICALQRVGINGDNSVFISWSGDLNGFMLEQTEGVENTVSGEVVGIGQPGKP